MSISLVRPDNSQMMAAKQAAAQFLNGEVGCIDPIGGGRNSQVYRLLGPDGHDYALKIYFQHSSDRRDRLGTEFIVLQFLWKNGVRNIPRPIVADLNGNCALYEYIDGKPPSADEITDGDIDQAVLFLAAIKDLNNASGSRALPNASEACFSITGIVNDIKGRLRRLQYLHIQEYPNLHVFLDSRFMPMFEEVISWCHSSLAGSDMSFESEISSAERTLSPSDFGYHNALKRNNGQIIFLDFEYFGWDDPAKMTVDVLLHPGMCLTDDYKRRFLKGILKCFSDCPQLHERIKIVYPLFALKWCMILLNEFLPERLARRQFSGVGSHGFHQFQTEQLGKAEKMLQKIQKEYKHFPYLD